MMSSSSKARANTGKRPYDLPTSPLNQEQDRLFLVLDVRSDSIQAVLSTESGQCIRTAAIELEVLQSEIYSFSSRRSKALFVALDKVLHGLKSQLESGSDQRNIFKRIALVGGASDITPHFLSKATARSIAFLNTDFQFSTLSLFDVFGESAPTSLFPPTLCLQDVVKLEDNTMLQGIDGIFLEGMVMEAVLTAKMPKFNLSSAVSTELYDRSCSKWKDNSSTNRSTSSLRPGSVNNERTERIFSALGTVEAEIKDDIIMSSGDLISQYFVDRFGFSPDCRVAHFLVGSLSESLSIPLLDRDILIDFGKTNDRVLVWSDQVASLQDIKIELDMNSRNCEAGVAIISLPEISNARCSICHQYCDGIFSLFDRYLRKSPYGGSAGIDNKSFCFFSPSIPLENAPPRLDRFSLGRRVDEFADPKTNPRILIESEFLYIRARLSEILSSTSPSVAPPAPLASLSMPAFSLLSFDPFSTSFLPSRIILLDSEPHYGSSSAALHQIIANILGAAVYKIKERESTLPSARSAIGARRRLRETFKIMQRTSDGPELSVTAETKRMDTSEKDTAEELILLARPAADQYRYYGGLLEERERLYRILQKGL